MMPRFTMEERTRITAGWQCPECFGVRIETREERKDAFLCVECGCQWDSLYLGPMRPELPKAKVRP